MFKVLNEEEKQNFVEQYFKEWKKDIWKVSLLSVNNIDEYLVNEHYLFLVKNGKE